MSDSTNTTNKDMSQNQAQSKSQPQSQAQAHNTEKDVVPVTSTTKQRGRFTVKTVQYFILYETLFFAPIYHMYVCFSTR